MSKRCIFGLIALVLIGSCAQPAPIDQATVARKLELPDLGEDRPGDYPEVAREEQIRALVAAEYADTADLVKGPVHATITFVDLNGDGQKEALAYVEGPRVCGTSGCWLSVYTPDAGAYREIAYLIGYPPVRALQSSSRGWRDQALWVQGGGHMHGFEGAVAFDGREYSGKNLSNPPAWRVPSGTAGDILIPNRLTVVEGSSSEGPPPPPFGPDRR